MTSSEREQLVQRCVHRYHEGASLSQISSEVGRSYGFVRRLLLQAGVTLRPRGGPHHRSPPAPR